MQYFIVLKLLRLQVTQLLYYFAYFFLLVQKKTNKTQKTTELGFLEKTRVFEPCCCCCTMKTGCQSGVNELFYCGPDSGYG